jgi:uncharacterized protein (TIGR00369 family)
MVEREEFIDDLRRRMVASDFHRWIGIELLDARPGEVDLVLEAEPRHLNLQGLLHGGMIATLADTATGLAVRTKLEPGTRHVTVQLDVQFLSPGRPGKIFARGRVIRAGRQIAHTEAEITDAGGKLLAKAHSTVAIMNDRRAASKDQPEDQPEDQ